MTEDRGGKVGRDLAREMVTFCLRLPEMVALSQSLPEMAALSTRQTVSA